MNLSTWDNPLRLNISGVRWFHKFEPLFQYTINGSSSFTNISRNWVDLTLEAGTWMRCQQGLPKYLLLRPKQTSMSASTNIYFHTINHVKNIHMSWCIPLDPKVPVFLGRWRPVYPRESKLAGDAWGSFQVRVDVSWTNKWVFQLWDY